MKKIMVLTMTLALVAFATGCKTQHAGKLSVTDSIMTKTIVATPAVTAGGKISGSAEIMQVLGYIWGDTKYADGVEFNGEGVAFDIPFWGAAIQKVKAAAAFDACQKSGADIILSPNYNVKVTDYFVFKVLSADVKGFKGTIDGVSNIETLCPIRDIRFGGCKGKPCRNK